MDGMDKKNNRKTITRLFHPPLVSAVMCCTAGNGSVLVVTPVVHGDQGLYTRISAGLKR